jgi:archaemetzincin
MGSCRAWIAVEWLALTLGCSERHAASEPSAPARVEPRGGAEDEPEHHAALGDVRHLPPEIVRWLDGRRFEAKRPPRPGEWLAEHHEPGQSFGHYVIGNPNRVDDQRRIVYLQPLGAFSEDAPPLPALEGFTTDYFGLPVHVLPVRELDGLGITQRSNPHGGGRQLLTDDLLTVLRDELPDDAFCLLGITMSDLYPGDEWNFVFGQASLHGRVGVYSFARHVSDDPTTTLRRGVKILAHETGHMFSMEHCIHYECVMNGSNHLPEADSQPLHLCPVCLLKLHHAVGFDPTRRYQTLAERYASLGMHSEAAWIREHL